MPKDMHYVVEKNLISSFKRYSTTVQDTILRIIGERLQETYDLTDSFTDILLEPDASRPDIIKAKSKQYNFDLRDEAALSEHIKLLEAINQIYSKRGSIDSIEHMWKYYGGNLPKDVKISIPANDIFRYNISKWSGSHKFQDDSYYRSGVYNININGDYDVNALREFVNKEFVAAGTEVYYNKFISSYISGTDYGSLYASKVIKRTILDTTSLVSYVKSGLIWSMYSPYKTWSGRPNLFIDISRVFEINVSFGDIIVYDISIIAGKGTYVIVTSNDVCWESTLISITNITVCTPTTNNYIVEKHFYDIEGNEITSNTSYPGYFVLGETLLGEVIKQ